MPLVLLFLDSIPKAISFGYLIICKILKRQSQEQKTSICLPITAVKGVFYVQHVQVDIFHSLLVFQKEKCEIQDIWINHLPSPQVLPPNEEFDQLVFKVTSNFLQIMEDKEFQKLEFCS